MEKLLDVKNGIFVIQEMVLVSESCYSWSYRTARPVESDPTKRLRSLVDGFSYVSWEECLDGIETFRELFKKDFEVRTVSGVVDQKLESGVLYEILVEAREGRKAESKFALMGDHGYKFCTKWFPFRIQTPKAGETRKVESWDWVEHAPIITLTEGLQ